MHPYLIILIITIFYSTSFTQKEKVFESFVDSIRIDNDNLFKVEFHRYGVSEYNEQRATVNFLKEKDNNWDTIQKFEFDNVQTPVCNPEVKDINEDGFLDFSFTPFIAARGGNVLREHILFNIDSNKFIYITNSTYYPNLSYNTSLDCFIGYTLTGSTTQYFLELQLDSLIRLASINIDGLERELTVYDKNGEEIFSKIDTIEKEGFHFYKNYDPIEE